MTRDYRTSLSTAWTQW